MFNRVLRRIQEKVRRRQYAMTYHARKEMQEDGFAIYDVERGILTGEILERQRVNAATRLRERDRLAAAL